MSYQPLTEALLSNKPYFGPALRALQGPPERHRYILPTFACLPPRSDRQELHILEIGSWAGASTISWLAAMRRLGISGKVTCVDPWQEYFGPKESDRHYREMDAAARDGLIFPLFQHNISAAGFAGDVEVRRGTAQAVLPDLPDRSFDVIYIDGSHRFRDVVFDIGQAKRLSRQGGIICGDDLELQARELAQDELTQAIASNRDWVYSEIAGRYYHPGVTGAVAQEFESVGVWNGFWAVSEQGGLWMPAILDESRCWLPDHIHLAIEHSERDERNDSPKLSGSYRGFNLVQYGGNVYGLRQSLGHIDLASEAPPLTERYSASDVLIGESLGEIRARIDALELDLRISRLSEHLASLEKGTGEARELASQFTAVLERAIADVREATSADLAASAQELTSRFTAALERAIAAAAQQSDEQMRSLDKQVQAEALALIGDLEAKLGSLNREQRLLARHVTLLENGPGDPQAPCLAGEHRGFSLVHYQGRAYGLRKPMDLEELRSGEELLERFGADQVIVGQSLDGVRARIDVLEGLRQLRTELELVDRELSVTGSGLGRELEQVKSTLQMHARDLEKLTGTWFTRLRRALR